MKMINIKKAPQPPSLVKYKQTPDSIYDGPNFTQVKADIKLSLLKEQGHICAYCMRRIRTTDMKVEHFQCQHSNPRLQLDYNNLLGCCKGYEGKSPKFQTCDTRKGSGVLSYSPAAHGEFVNRSIKFGSNGRITSNDDKYNDELNDVLNLNLKELKSYRAAAWDGVEHQLNNKKGKRTRAEIQKVFDKYLHTNSQGKYQEYRGVVLYYLNKKIKSTK